jgi:hypothetical protein
MRPRHSQVSIPAQFAFLEERLQRRSENAAGSAGKLLNDDGSYINNC